jgi:hypothetical protein
LAFHKAVRRRPGAKMAAGGGKFKGGKGFAAIVEVIS